MRCIPGTITAPETVSSEEELKVAKTTSRDHFYRQHRAEQLARASETIRPSELEPCIEGTCPRTGICGTTCQAAVLQRVQAALADLDGAPA
ncbi:MAG TPA: hypothetical protein VEI97_02855 [bacterium]|nr:hypothetical protein [bacterium]